MAKLLSLMAEVDIVLRLDDSGRDIPHSVQKGVLSSMVQPFLTLRTMPRACLKFTTISFGYAPQGSGGMSYCNQTPFSPREGWSLGTRLLLPQQALE